MPPEDDAHVPGPSLSDVNRIFGPALVRAVAESDEALRARFGALDTTLSHILSKLQVPEKSGDVESSIAIHERIEDGIARITAQAATRDATLQAERQSLVRLHGAIGALVRRIDVSVAEAEATRSQFPGDLSTLSNAVSARVTEDGKDWRDAFQRGMERIASGFETQENKLEAERRGMQRLISGLGSAFDRLEATIDKIGAHAEASEPGTEVSEAFSEVLARFDVVQASLAEFPTKAAMDALLDVVKAELVEGVEKMSEAVGRLSNGNEAARSRTLQLLAALGSVAGRLDQGVSRLESHSPVTHSQPDVVAALAEFGARIDALGAQAPGTQSEPPLDDNIQNKLLDRLVAVLDTMDKPTDMRAEIARGVDRIAALVGAQDRRFQAERQRMARFVTALDTVFTRIEATTIRIEATNTLTPDPNTDIAARLTQLEAGQANLIEQLQNVVSVAQIETQEAIRDMGLIIAEMLARQERQGHARDIAG